MFCTNLTINIINYLVFKIDLRMYWQVKIKVALLLLLLFLFLSSSSSSSSPSSHLRSVFIIIYLKHNMFLGYCCNYSVVKNCGTSNVTPDCIIFHYHFKFIVACLLLYSGHLVSPDLNWRSKRFPTARFRMMCAVFISVIFSTILFYGWPGSNWRFWYNPFLIVPNAPTITFLYLLLLYHQSYYRL